MGKLYKVHKRWDFTNDIKISKVKVQYIAVKPLPKSTVIGMLLVSNSKSWVKEKKSACLKETYLKVFGC